MINKMKDGQEEFRSLRSFPPLYLLKQKIWRSAMADVEAGLLSELEASGIRKVVDKGTRAGIAVGSRGIKNLALIIRTIVGFIRSCGGEAVVIPAMGSHGGASAAGQVKVLEHCGVTAGRVGAKICAGMEVLDYGPAGISLHTWFDREAAGCDLIVAVNRIKEHTDFFGRTESGILKIIAVGLGNDVGATYIHGLGVAGLTKAIPAVAEKVMAHHEFYGVGIVEDGAGDTTRIEVMQGRQIASKEAELLTFSKIVKPKLPFGKIDYLVIEEIGKNISGSGVDTKVIGRIRYPGVPEPESPAPDVIAGLRLTPESEGNAAGVGLLDIISRHLYDAIDFDVTFANARSSKSPERYKIPMHFGHDEETVRIGWECAKMWDSFRGRIAVIKNTAMLETLYVSKPLRDEADNALAERLTDRPRDLCFDKEHRYISLFNQLQ